MQNLSWATVLAGGFINSLNPCAITVLLLFIGLLFSLQKTRQQTLSITLAYISAIYLTYLAIGLGLLKVFYLFGQTNIISHFLAIIIILVATYGLLENIFPKVPHYLTIRPNQRQKLNKWMNNASIPAAIIAGILVGFFQFPCGGAIYVTIIALLIRDATYWNGVLYLLGYNLAFIAPLLIIVMVTHNRLVAEKIISFQEKNAKSSRILLHSLLLIMGIALLFFIK